MMRYVKLGRTGLDVSPIALGCMGYGEPDRGHRIEAPYTPRHDFQGISDDARLARISARIGIKPASA
jgi:aryl-alcohol dehydrogenase-like predicted oxidoreductase